MLVFVLPIQLAKVTKDCDFKGSTLENTLQHSVELQLIINGENFVI